MGVLQIIGGILLLLTCVLLVILVLMQSAKQDGMQALTGSQADSYLSNNRNKTREARLVFLTKVFTAVFFVLTVLVNVLVTYINA